MIWLLKNVRNRLKFAAKNPRYAFDAILREITQADERFLARITNGSAREIRKYLNEPARTPEFVRHLREADVEMRAASIESADLYAKKILNQYVAVRALAPECVVETGIANGVSSSYLLLALLKNGKGCLHSVGLADPAYLPPGRDPGWVVPQWLRAQWHVHLGDSRDVLPGLLQQLGTIDVFAHDSLHTYDHMMWEFEASYPHLKRGGLLFSDDALWNDAFKDFARRVGCQQARILRGVGFLRRPDTESA
jgi:predicted O-methyltransferase YrrM